MDNLPDFLRGKKFLLITGGLVLLLLVLIIFANSDRSKSEIETRQPGQVDFQVQDSTFNDDPSLQSPEVQQAIQEQMQADQEYSDWQENNETNYPWLRKLPLTSEKYFVYFDLNRKVFIGKLYLQPEDDQDQIKSNILNILKVEEEIPVDNFQFEWVVNT